MEKSDFVSSESHETNSMTEFYWDCIGPDLTELILSYLPIPTIIVATSVCKFWNSIIHSNPFKTRISHSKKSWFFLSGKNKLFAFIPESDNWIELSKKTLLSKNPFEASINWSFTWSQASPPDLSCRYNPLFGACDQTCCSKPDRYFIAIYGIDHLFDIGDCLAADLPYYFRPGNSSCTALFNGKLYIFGTSSNFISCFDLEKRLWSDVKTLRPPGVMLSFLISCENQLVLGGLCSSTTNYDLEFNLWRIDEETLEFSEIGIMPGELLSSFMDSEEDKRFPCFKCAGFSNLVFVFTENIGCVCEISNSGKCSWRRVSTLPQSVYKFDKIISFTCNVSLLDFLGNGKD